MGTASTTKFIKNVSGQLTEQAALKTSAGAGDADAVVALNGAGVLDASIINSKTSSAGAGDSGKIPALGVSGRLDESFMPTGIGADTQSITASEGIAAGDLVNIWNSTGAKVRKADATVAGKEAHGFVKAAVLSAASATVYFEGNNDSVTGLTPGVQYLSTTAGLCSDAAPTGTGNVVQRVGFATATGVLNFQCQDPIVLA